MLKRIFQKDYPRYSNRDLHLWEDVYGVGTVLKTSDFTGKFDSAIECSCRPTDQGRKKNLRGVNRARNANKKK